MRGLFDPDGVIGRWERYGLQRFDPDGVLQYDGKILIQVQFSFRINDICFYFLGLG